MNAAPSRPVLRYHGGKWMLAPWIISHFRPHRCYTETFGGAASVLAQKERTYAEVWNDLDQEIYNLFRVMRQMPGRLINDIRLTPFSRMVYKQSFQPSDDMLEQAVRTMVRSFMGFGSNSLCRTVKSGFRSNSNRSGTTPALDWMNLPECLPAIIERFRGVVLENKSALEVMADHDGPDTLHYCDPPYVHSTRTTWAGSGARKGYQHEMSDADHSDFAECVKSLKGGGNHQRLPFSFVRSAVRGLERFRTRRLSRWCPPAKRSPVDELRTRESTA